ncbi:hypothetical protein L3049_17945 [Labilibaculum sp. DW002]|uniref:Lipoprotein n=1 Tax=Paralabilibaculum antarcticum TaxID=2912572 RepID=A0ABT5VYK4_9BACT|nr:hypothetical protein [Labilibaculum sp. DW002]MDE5419877.1 hypothetical protein [Labilibaculum sp. DW002]
MLKKLCFLLGVTLLVSCSEKDEFSDPSLENVNAISAKLNENVLLLHNSKLANSNGDEGMAYDEETGVMQMSLESVEMAEYKIENTSILSVDLDTLAVLRKVAKVDTIGDIINVHTEETDFEEVFRDADFELVSDMTEDVDLKTASTIQEINEALRDGNKIHPARVIYHMPEGRIVRSVFNDEQIDGVEMFGNTKKTISINFSKKIENYTLFEKSEQITNEETGESYSEKSGIYLTSGEINYGADFSLKTKVKWFKLRKFEFSVSPHVFAEANFLMRYAKSYTREDEIKLMNNVFKRTFIYYVGACVLAITVDTDIMAAYKVESNGFLQCTAGFNASISSKFGAKYKRKKGWSAINEFEFNKELYTPQFMGEVNANLRAEIFPRTKAKICGVNGITIDMVPYVNTEIHGSFLNTKVDGSVEMSMGLDARINAKVKIAKKNLGGFEKEYQIVKPIVLFDETYSN